MVETTAQGNKAEPLVEHMMTPKPDENAVRQIFEQLEHLGLIYDSGEREDGYVAYDLRDFGELTREAQKAVLDYLDREPASHWVLGRYLTFNSSIARVRPPGLRAGCPGRSVPSGRRR